MSRRIGVAVPEFNDKKDLRNEIKEIGVFTLFFSDSHVEARWNRLHLKRHLSITTRFLFVAALFQGLFFWSDCIERQPHLFNLAIIRICIGGLSLLGSFLVASGLLVPTQGAMLMMNLTYGLPTMAVFYLTRKTLSHWHSLYLVYGMIFMILPKVSPLNFMYAFGGALMFTLSFIVLSAFRLPLQQWLLSNCLLFIVIMLFCYDSYNSERLSRERWLLRDRLQREHINLKIVASSIQDDLSKTSADLNPSTLSSSVFSTLKASNAVNMNSTFARSGGSGGPDAKSNESASKEDQSKRFVLFFKGLIAWALCYAFGYSFDFIALPISSLHHREVNSSAAFALLMHSMGFSIFLLYFTGQIRWLALNGIVSLLIMFLFNQSGMSPKWVIFSTHSLGYVLLFAVIVIMILVFGGVVLVWHHLVSFLKDVLSRYPQVKDELGQNKLLESVLIRYIADMPSTNLFQTDTPHELVIEYGKDEESSRSVSSSALQANADKQAPPKATETLKAPTRKTLESRRPNTCFFCLKGDPEVLVPACCGWEQRVNVDKPSGISMCTPYTDMVLLRDAMETRMKEALRECSFYQEKYAEMEIRLRDAIQVAEESRRHVSSSVVELKRKYGEVEGIVQRLVRTCEDKVKAEKRNFETKLQNLISQHNAQLADLKRQHKQTLMRFHNQAVLPVPPDEVKVEVQITKSAEKSAAIVEDAKLRKPAPAEDKDRRAGGISVIAPKKFHAITSSSDTEAKATTSELNRVSSVEKIGSSYSSRDSMTSLEALPAIAVPPDIQLNLEPPHEDEDDFDVLWKSTLEEIQFAFSDAYTIVSGKAATTPTRSDRNSSDSSSSRMKYVFSFDS